MGKSKPGTDSATTSLLSANISSPHYDGSISSAESRIELTELSAARAFDLPTLQARYDQITRWLMRSSTLRAILQFMSLQPHLFTDRRIPQQEIDLINRSLRTTRFLDGLHFATETAWPVTFFSLLIYDIGKYANAVDQRYGNTFGKLLLGISPNQATLTSWLMETYAWPITWMSLPSLFAVINMFRGRNAFDADMRSRFSNGLENASFTAQDAGAMVETILASRYTAAIILGRERNGSDAESQTVESRDFNIDNCNQHLVTALIGIADTEKRQKLWHLYYYKQTLDALADIADGLDAKALEKAGFTPDERTPYLQLRTNVLQKLEEESQFTSFRDRKFFTALYASYLLYTLGHSRLRRLAPLFSLVAGLGLYAKLRYWLTIEEFIRHRITFAIEKAACEAEHKVYLDMSQAGEYQCSVCGDWPEVFYPDMFDAQRCLDDLLQTQQTSTTLVERLPRLKPFGVRHVDFGQQLWPKWKQAEWQQVSDELLNISTQGEKKLVVFNSSFAFPHPEVLTQAQTKTLADFITSATPTKVIFRNQALGGNHTATFVTALDADTTELDLSAIQPEQTGVQALVQALDRLIKLTRLVLEDNQLTDSDLATLAPSLGKAPLQSLSLGGNNFTQQGLDALADAFSGHNSSLSTLQLNGAPLFNVNMTYFGQWLQRSKLQTFELRNTQLSDATFHSLFPSFVNSLLRQLDISGNSLTSASVNDFSQVLNNTDIQYLDTHNNYYGDYGLAYLGEAMMRGARVRVLDARACVIGDTGVHYFSQFLPFMPALHELFLNNNNIGAGLSDLAAALPHSNVSRLELSDNPLQPFLGALSQLLSSPKCPVTELAIAQTGMTGNDLASFTNALKQYPQRLHTLDISGNPIGDIACIEFVKILPQATHLTQLKMNDISASDACGTVLAEVLPRTQLTSLEFNNNKAPQLGLAIARELLKFPYPTQYEADILEPQLPRDLRRSMGHEAKPNTTLTHLSLVHTTMNTTSARALCRALPAAGIDVRQLQLTSNPVNQTQIDLTNCQISAATRLEPSILYLLITNLIRHSKESAQLLLQNDILSPPTHTTAPIVDDFPHQTQDIGFSSALGEIFSLALPTVNPTLLLECGGAIIWAFRDIIFHQLTTHLPESIQKQLETLRKHDDALFMQEITELLLRMKYAGVTTWAHDATQALRQAGNVEENAKITAREQQKTEAESTAWQYCARAVKGIAAVSSGYALATAINLVTENPYVGYLALPVIVGVTRSREQIKKSYQQHGFWAAVDTAVEKIAFSVPGGSYLEATAKNLSPGR